VSDQVTLRDLRPMLREAELAVARVHRGTTSQEILSLYGLLDQIAVALPQLQQAGAPLESECVRFETIGAILQEKAPIVVRGLAAEGGLEDIRRQNPRPEGHSWWYLDRQVAQQHRRRQARLVRSAGIALALIVILVALYILFLRPDKATRLRYDYQFGADVQLQQGNYAQALELYTKTLELAPEDQQLYLVIGVLYEALERPEEAARQYAEAERRYESPAAFRTARAEQYIRLSWYSRAVEEAQAAIELDERYALAHCALGSAHQGLGDNNAAIAALWECSDLASDQGQDELYVRARTLLATLMQQPS
jgi:tetratricopeptide (TPR) repeat protein